MIFTSPEAFQNFNHSVRRKRRYVRELAQDNFLEAVLATSRTRSKQLNAGAILWRAQLGHCWREEEREDGCSVKSPIAYGPKGMKPIPEKVLDGRVNPKGIICLYLATDKKTAVLETRPFIGSYVSVAQFRVIKDIRLVDCSADRDPRTVSDLINGSLSPQKIEKKVWSDINRAFAKSADRGDDSMDYVPTQILAETFKSREFDGIEYKSSYGAKGVNIALFDISAADPMEVDLYRVDNVSVKISKCEND